MGVVNVETMQTILEAVTADYNTQMEQSARVTEEFTNRVTKAIRAINGMSTKIAPDVDVTSVEDSLARIKQLEDEYTKLQNESNMLKQKMAKAPGDSSQQFFDKQRLADYEDQLKKIDVELTKLEKQSIKGVGSSEKDSAFGRVSAEINRATEAMTAFETKASAVKAILAESAVSAKIISDSMASVGKKGLPGTSTTAPTTTTPVPAVAPKGAANEWNRVDKAVRKTHASIRDVNRTSRQSSFSNGGLLSMFGRFIKMMVVFRTIFYIMSKVSESMNNASVKSERVNSAFSQLKTATVNIANSLAVAVLPIIKAIAPIVEAIARKIMIAGNAIAQFMAGLLGQSTYVAVIDSPQKWGDNATKAISKVKGQLLGFDKLNVLNPDDNESGSGSEFTGAGFTKETAVDPKYIAMTEKLRKVFQSIGSTFNGVVRPAIEKLWPKIERLGGIAFETGVKIAEFVKELWNAGVGDAVASFVDAAGNVVEIVGNLFDGFNDLDDWLKTTSGNNVGLIDIMGKAISDYAESVEDLTDALAKLTGGDTKGAMSSFSRFMGTIFDPGIQNLGAFQQALYFMMNPIAGVVKVVELQINAIIAVINTLASGIYTVKRAMGGTVQERYLSFVNFADAYNKANASPGAYGSQALPSTASSYASSSKNVIKTYNVRGYASGTVVQPNTPHLALFGDNKSEPEVVSPYPLLVKAAAEGTSSSSRTSNETNQLLRQLISAVMSDRTTILNADGKEIAKVTAKPLLREYNRLGITSLSATARV